jgi:hypothetical protein
LQSTDFLTINEKRHAIGYGPIEGGDMLDKSRPKTRGIMNIKHVACALRVKASGVF